MISHWFRRAYRQFQDTAWCGARLYFRNLQYTTNDRVTAIRISYGIHFHILNPGFAIAAVLAAVLLTGCSSITSVRVSKADDLAAIDAFNRQYLQAINSGDSEALAGLTTEDHVMLAPNRSPVIGKTANVAAMKRAFEQFDIQESWTPLETEVAGDWAYQRGTYQVTATPKNGGTSRTSTGNFLRIYRRQPDGSWSLIRDMFNNDQPPATD